ncbi:MAG: helix-turn-helix transcriptional regulator [Synergistaceae bacterium]|nr:helix-turn-helix transcriptional regulator [Synergistaceae bacterium]
MNKIALGEKIKQAREAKNMTQEEFAEAIGFSTDHVSVIERGVQLPRVDKLVDIANVLGVGVDYLLCDDLVVSTEIRSSIISNRLAKLPYHKQRFILAVLETMLKEFEAEP